MGFILPTHADMVANIRDIYFSATEQQIVDGANWYSDAANLARSLSESSGYSLEQTAGVIAALSPNTGWGQNVRLAQRMVDSRGTLNSGGLPNNLSKAREILHTDNRGAIASILFGKAANKVLAFWEGIMADGKTDSVCVDRHAFCVATNMREMTSTIPSLSAGGRYSAIVEAYREAAIGTPFTAAQMQAITWVTWRNMHWAAGAFDGK